MHHPIINSNNQFVMKSILFLFITFITFSIQSQTVEGTYSNKWVSNSGEGIQYTLTLEENEQFIFEYERMYLDDNMNKKLIIEGTWSLENNLLVLDTDDESEKDNMIASGLDLNKARFISLSPRNPKFNLVKPLLKFYESEVFYAKDMELVKTSSSVSIIE